LIIIIIDYQFFIGLVWYSFFAFLGFSFLFVAWYLIIVIVMHLYISYLAYS